MSLAGRLPPPVCGEGLRTGSPGLALRRCGRPTSLGIAGARRSILQLDAQLTHERMIWGDLFKHLCCRDVLWAVVDEEHGLGRDTSFVTQRAKDRRVGLSTP